ncbi:hypothetical protein DDI_3341 [Dickeya dianthicola RNS04.9]|nr:hypothetical protein DDI_3341 [Dickeya dianthicola RNS04.9]
MLLGVVNAVNGKKVRNFTLIGAFVTNLIKIIAIYFSMC